MIRNLFLITIFSIALLTSCGSAEADLSSPKATFETLVEAVQDKDLETYEKCWHPERVEREGMFSELKEGGEVWNELQGILSGPQNVRDIDYLEHKGKEMAKMSVEAPEAAEGGIGGVTLIKVDGEWKMWGW